jgi:hypothetical protein
MSIRYSLNLEEFIDQNRLKYKHQEQSIMKGIKLLNQTHWSSEVSSIQGGFLSKWIVY